MFQSWCLRCTASVATEWVTYSTILWEDPSLATVLIFHPFHLQVYTLSICLTFYWALFRSYVPSPLSSYPKPLEDLYQILFKMHKRERWRVTTAKQRYAYRLKKSKLENSISHCCKHILFWLWNRAVRKHSSCFASCPCSLCRTCNQISLYLSCFFPPFP